MLQKEKCSHSYFNEEMHKYYNMCKKNKKSLSKEEELSLIIKSKQGNEKAKEELLKNNLKYIFFIANKYKNLGIPFIDLFQEGCIGLLISINKFNPEFKCKFSTYSIWWIKQSILKYISLKVNEIRLPLYITNNIVKYQKMLKKTNNNLEEKNLSLKEINKCIDISIDNLKQILEIKNRKYIYIDELREQNVNELYNSFNNNEVETKIMSEKMKKNVNNLLSKLDLRSKEVIKLRYGINSENKEHSLSEISKKLNLSRERIRQLQIKALRKMHFSAVRNNITM